MRLILSSFDSNIQGQRRGTTQIVGGEVGAKVPTVADDGPILHEASVIEGFLPGNDVVMSKQHLSGGGDNLVGYGYGVVIGVISEDAHHRESQDHHEGDPLHPPFTDDHRSTTGLLGFLAFIAHGANLSFIDENIINNDKRVLPHHGTMPGQPVSGSGPYPCAIALALQRMSPRRARDPAG